jgi:hypothetical protein
MAERIERDPRLEGCPTFTGVMWTAARNGVIADEASPEVVDVATAIGKLRANWAEENAERVVLFLAQEAADEVTRREEAEQLAAAHMLLELEERRDADKKKTRFPSFTKGQELETAFGSTALPFAQDKVNKGELVPLYYYTKEGLAEARLASYGALIDGDTLGLSRVGDTMTLRPIAAHSASKNEVPDEQLCWESTQFAKIGYLLAIAKADWPIEWQDAVGAIFARIEAHDAREEDFGEQALVIYLAKMRVAWHLGFKSGKTFDIGTPICPLKLKKIKEDLLDRSRAEKDRMVSVHPLHKEAATN